MFHPCSRGHYPSHHLSETHLIPIPLRPTRDRQAVAILEEFASFTGGEFKWIFATPGDFQHGAVGVRRGAAEGAGRHHVAGAHVAAGDGMMRELLSDMPVHIFEVGTGNGHRFRHGFAL